ncbi:MULTISPECIES: hypothetical protein [Rhodobacterales]|jgi:hypothetical protein|uniref:hypothetical protein n=1 Tax=Rhodobacterales TaxID=204455 RepID=UPI00237EFA9E|nr:hypothetical protein [Phaeobacter gallaeciensis]MDE4138832.1 hypothetical protein [Phaeobacter gallaeciensis]MDE4148110.1 hypothetical protein [Phaeobacter gallaeciensis]MDE4152328.1 hypothetical protein [Phaeobacter gallaeciensis]MDE4226888.1 hypothetical protein [Phaeobacter gallaeciensis]MDE4256792.1 hypothetical protein [Phaeobacter gallaeciensis]
MKLLFAVCAALAVMPRQAQAEADKTPPFDTPGFLAECTNRIPNVAMQIPMNQLCVSAARQLCDLSTGGQGASQCLSTVTEWLETDITRIRSSFPDAAEMVEKPSGMSPLPMGAAQAIDCSQLKVPNVSSEGGCSYQEAVSRWLKFRVVELSSQPRED